MRIYRAAGDPDPARSRTFTLDSSESAFVKHTSFLVSKSRDEHSSARGVDAENHPSMVICELDETEILETSRESSARLSVDRVIVAQGRQG